MLVDTSPDLRWIGNGRTSLDNKGNPVRQYEPYFSSTHEYEDEAELVEQGVSALIHYDPIGRAIRTDFPDGTFSKVEFTPWESTSRDANDTVADSDWYAARYNYVGADVYWQKERRAAELAYDHGETPSKMIFDSLGRPFLGIEDLGGGTTYETKVVLDIRGLPSQIIDARGNVAEARTYGILGQVLETTSVDAGDRQAPTTILGEPLRAWDAKDQCARVTYDALRRPVDGYVQPAVGGEILLSRVIYGESLGSPQTTNHRGRAYRSYDGGGQATHAANATTTTYDYDPLSFRLRSHRQRHRHPRRRAADGLLPKRDRRGRQQLHLRPAVSPRRGHRSREHATQGTTQRSATQLPRDSNPVPMANDPNALRRYTQSYTYDAVGNLKTVVHAPASGTGWTRRYQYRTDGNRLVGTSAPGGEWDYGSNGNLQPQRDIDFTNHGYPDQHVNPHQHNLTPNSEKLAPKGGYKRGKGRPL